MKRHLAGIESRGDGVQLQIFQQTNKVQQNLLRYTPSPRTIKTNNGSEVDGGQNNVTVR